jgi:hypothetical protein
MGKRQQGRPAAKPKRRDVTGEIWDEYFRDLDRAEARRRRAQQEGASVRRRRVQPRKS